MSRSDSAAPHPSSAVFERPTATRAVAIWLFVCCALVFAIVVVGGITRLTHSGLSITEWQPIVGALPPLNDAQWDEVFRKYQATPEYREVNPGMSLPAFQRIFWWEYVHRLLGRLIGVVFLVPLLVFIVRRRIPRGYAAPLAAIFVLGGLQGALGWYMVQSGLVDDPRVSQLRLTAHLGLALGIFSAMLWAALSLVRDRGTTPTAASLRCFSRAVVVLVFVMVLSGGLVAGIRAGFAYNTFPTMNGAWIPREILLLDPWYLNFVNNMATVQFDHRLLAAVVAMTILAFAWRVWVAATVPPQARLAVGLLALMLVLQIALGIATLLTVVALPLAALHQAGAVLLLALAIIAAHVLR